MQKNTKVLSLLVHSNDSRFIGKLVHPVIIKDLPHGLVDFDNYSEFRLLYAVYFEQVDKNNLKLIEVRCIFKSLM